MLWHIVNIRARHAKSKFRSSIGDFDSTCRVPHPGTRTGKTLRLLERYSTDLFRSRLRSSESSGKSRKACLYRYGRSYCSVMRREHLVHIGSNGRVTQAACNFLLACMQITRDGRERKRDGKLTVNARSMGTVSSSVSYILRFLQAVFKMILRNVVRSMAHSDPRVIACIVG